MASFVPRALVGGGVRIPLSAVPNPRVLKRNLTAQQWVMGEEETTDVPAYEVERAYITVPRVFGLHLIAEMGLEYDDARSDGAHRTYSKVIKHEGQYAYQESFVAQMVAAANRYGDFLAEAATGMGKTEMALSMIQRLGRTALIVVDQENLLTQWRDRAKNSLGLTDKQIGIVQGKECDYEGKHLVIAMMQSLSQRRYEMPLYDWPGIVVFDECFHPSHDLLTSAGWKPVADVTLDDLVAQVDADTGEVSFANPTRVVARACREGLVHYEDAHCDLLATPGHQHLVYWRGVESDPHKVSYEELQPTNRWSYRVAGYTTGQDRVSAWERFLIAYQADGTYIRYAGRKGEHHLRFSFRKQRKVTRLLKVMGDVNEEWSGVLRWRISTNARGDTNIQVWSTRSVSKVLSWLPMTRSTSYYEGALQELVEWDGWSSSGDVKFYESTIEENASVVHAVAVLAGRIATLARYGRAHAQHADRYRVSWYGGPFRQTKSLRKTHVPYKGLVHCVVVPSGNVITRRNGKVSVTGNCHTAGAPTFSKVMLQFSARVRVGISATVDRKDALQKLIHWNLGEVRASLKQAHTRSYVYYVESPTVYSWYATISPKTGRIIEEVSSDPVRNRMLVEAIRWLYETGRDTLVVSDRIEQLEALRSMLHYSGVPKEDTGLYCGYRTVWQYEKDPKPKRKPEGYESGTQYTPVVLTASRKRVAKIELERVKETAKVLFATYGMMAKGVDVPRLSGGIDCTHRTKAQQVHGRVLRHVDGKLVPVWITVRDVNCYRLEHQFLQRLDEYAEDNAEVYQFDLANGVVRKESLPVLKKDIRENIKELKCLNTVAHADGGYALVNPQ